MGSFCPSDARGSGRGTEMCKGGQKKDWDESRTPESSPSVKEGFTLLTGGGSVATRKGGKGVSREKLIVHDRNGRGGVGQGRGGGGQSGVCLDRLHATPLPSQAKAAVVGRPVSRLRCPRSSSQSELGRTQGGNSPSRDQHMPRMSRRKWSSQRLLKSPEKSYLAGPPPLRLPGVSIRASSPLPSTMGCQSERDSC